MKEIWIQSVNATLGANYCTLRLHTGKDVVTKLDFIITSLPMCTRHRHIVKDVMTKPDFIITQLPSCRFFGTSSS
jgi:porphobilinogen deaminase